LAENIDNSKQRLHGDKIYLSSNILYFWSQEDRRGGSSSSAGDFPPVATNMEGSVTPARHQTTEANRRQSDQIWRELAEEGVDGERYLRLVVSGEKDSLH
jgi:hypothetical protein